MITIFVVIKELRDLKTWRFIFSSLRKFDFHGNFSLFVSCSRYCQTYDERFFLSKADFIWLKMSGVVRPCERKPMKDIPKNIASPDLSKVALSNNVGVNSAHKYKFLFQFRVPPFFLHSRFFFERIEAKIFLWVLFFLNFSLAKVAFLRPDQSLSSFFSRHFPKLQSLL